MELKIKHPNSSESFSLDIKKLEVDNGTFYNISFDDKILSEKYGTVLLKRRSDNFWKFPDSVDNFLMQLLSEAIFQIMYKEIN